MNWKIKESEFHKERIEFYGSRFCIGNGYFGYRGTLEEFRREQLAACTLSELFDDNGSGWREPVNLPNPLYTFVQYKQERLSVLDSRVQSHNQELLFDCGLHRRKTVYLTEDQKEITVEAERFASIEDIHLLVMRYKVSAGELVEIDLITEIDKEVWDINGPHFKSSELLCDGEISGLKMTTMQEGQEVAVSQSVRITEGTGTMEREGISFRIHGTLNKGDSLVIEKYVAICKETDSREVWKEASERNRTGAAKGFDALLEGQKGCWKQRYENLGIMIRGDEEAMQAVYYSCYLLLSSAPFHTDRVAIPARGLSGQVYKGAMFWDTEIYMLPMFAFCEPETARNLVSYRIRNLAGALEKSQEYGYRGAFYPWESQENGKDGCTHYNLTDIFTGRKMRTYFRDKQIHISADVAYGIWKYICITKDYSLLTDGGAEVILQCARFFHSYSYYKPEKKRYEFLDVTGADEYHERVNNDAYTNYMIHLTMKTALMAVEYMEQNAKEQFNEIMNRLNYYEELQNIRDIYNHIYLPGMDKDGIIEQFDGYFKEEDISIEELYSRRIQPNEYLGSPCGLAVNTQILKQADVVLLLSLLTEEFEREMKEKNWVYYELRTEHGSSLSTCVYALLAAQIGKTDWAYEYLMKAAKVDMDGNYKLYLGDLYIGGTHPAANGGSWMVTVQGFGGLTPLEDGVRLAPHLPKHWEELSYRFGYGGERYQVCIGKTAIKIQAVSGGQKPLRVDTESGVYTCEPGKLLTIPMDAPQRFSPEANA